MVILEVVKSLNDKSATVVFFFKLKRKQKRGRKRGKPLDISFERFLEREKLLSRFVRDPTVGGLRGKKENCSTRRGLRVGTRFREFSQTPRGRGFSLLGF